MQRSKIHLAVACAFGLAALGESGVVLADDATDTKAEIQLLKKQVEGILQKIDQLSSKEAATAAKQDKLEAKTASPGSAAPGFLQGIEFYGNLDLSLDSTTKGLKSSYPDPNTPGATVSPVGRMGYMPAISTNLSYLGLRGKHDLGNNLAAVYQLETQVDIAATAGTTNTNSNSDSTVKGALTSRNSFLGVAGGFGSVKIGKTDAPYKTSTAIMNPFSGMLGDYSVIMGNTGGDNRVEFGTRLDHAIWYDSPNMGGFSFHALVSPGQNRAYDNSIQAAGESDCAGGNIPGSGGTPYGCNDGSYGNAYSVSGIYTSGPLYVTAAYELHKDVNRQSDNPNPGDATSSEYISDESARKVGVQYRFPTSTTVSAIYEDMKRSKTPYVGTINVNERARSGYWLAVTQALTEKDNVSVGWAHANATPGDPGQHNTAPSSNPDNAANMYTVAYRHALDKQTSWYADYALTANHSAAHYDLGAGGRAVTTDCHDGSQVANSGTPIDPANPDTGPHCYAGGRLQGFSVGMTYKF